MKKLMLSVAALAVALIGFGTLSVSTTHANPSKIWVINDNVSASIATAPVPAATLDTALATQAGRAPYVTQFDAFVTATDGQIGVNAAIPFAGNTYIVVQSDGSGTNIALNGRGLTCTPLCDGVFGVAPDPTDHIAVWQVTAVGAHVAGDTFVVTAIQDTVSVDSATQTIVGQAHDVQLVAVKTTIQEGLTSCALTDSTSAPTRSGVGAIYTDINGKALVGYFTTFKSSNSHMKVVLTIPTVPTIAVTVSYLLSDGTTVAAPEVICGITAGTANLTAQNSNADSTDNNAIAGITGPVVRTQAITITGVPAAIALTAAPSTISCDGVNSSTITAKVTDSAGNNVVDNTPVTFSVVALGTANPIQTKTTAGSASSTVTPLSVATAGVTVIVSSGDVSTSTRVDCALPVPTTAPAPSATPRGGIGGPDTGNGGYLNQSNASGFPMWTLVALMLGSVTLVAGGLVTRRAGK